MIISNDIKTGAMIKHTVATEVKKEKGLYIPEMPKIECNSEQDARVIQQKINEVVCQLSVALVHSNK